MSKFVMRNSIMDKNGKHVGDQYFLLAPHEVEPMCSLHLEGSQITCIGHVSEMGRVLRNELDQAVARRAEREGAITQQFRPKVVVPIGSTNSLHAYKCLLERETMNGNIVLMPGGRAADLARTGEEHEMLERLCERKIDMADEVVVLNVDGYVGNATRRLIHYAKGREKVIRWWEKSRIPPEFDSGTALGWP